MWSWRGPTRKQSYKAIKCLSLFKICYPKLITIESEDGEYKIPDSRYLCDGYDEKSNTIIEFHGDFWHGNPTIYKSNKVNVISGKTFGELYQKTLDKNKFILSKRYNYIEIWEQDWNIFEVIEKIINRYLECESTITTMKYCYFLSFCKMNKFCNL